MVCGGVFCQVRSWYGKKERICDWGFSQLYDCVRETEAGMDLNDRYAGECSLFIRQGAFFFSRLQSNYATTAAKIERGWVVEYYRNRVSVEHCMDNKGSVTAARVTYRMACKLRARK